MSWLSSGLQNLIALAAIATSFFAAIYWWFKDKIRDYKAGRKVNIANEPAKRGSDLLDGLSDD